MVNSTAAGSEVLGDVRSHFTEVPTAGGIFRPVVLSPRQSDGGIVYVYSVSVHTPRISLFIFPCIYVALTAMTCVPTASNAGPSDVRASGEPGRVVRGGPGTGGVAVENGP